jgi:protein SCO1/2
MQRRHVELLLAAAAGLLLSASPARGGDEHQAGKGAAPAAGCAHCDKEKAEAAARKAPAQAETKVTVVDRPLLDQDGRTVRFAKEVVGGDVVVMDFVFTHCTTICPVLSAKMVRLQSLLDARLGKGVKLVTLSLDPLRDSPAAMKAWGAKFKSGPHWQFITGRQEDQEAVLKGLGAYVANVAEHPPMILVGDGKTGRWVRINGFPDPKKVAALVEELLAGRKPTTAQAGGR